MTHSIARVVALATLVLIFAGGLVKSTETGLSDPTWPHFNGGYEPQLHGETKWEHLHRLIAGCVAMATIGLAAVAWRREMRTWVRRLAVVAVFAVLAQATFGGLTVLFQLKSLGISLTHSGLAQAFFAMAVTLAVVTSPTWLGAAPAPGARRTLLAPVATATAVATYVQILLGAWVRYTPGAPYAIHDFPLAYGGLIPPLGDHAIVVQFVHRVGALVVTVLAMWAHVLAMKEARAQRVLKLPAILLAALLWTQILLGGAVIWMIKAVVPTTFHVATGAALFASTMILALLAWRVRPAPAAPSRLLGDIATLTKARIAVLILIATAAGYYVASPAGELEAGRLLVTLLGTLLLSAGSAVANQYMERDVDALMRRTADRPLPAGRIRPRHAAIAAGVLGVAGFAILLALVNWRTAALGAATYASYVWLYTPLKRVSWISTIVGAVPGALPPVMGWAAATDSAGFEAWILFAIVFFWQMPHVFAIAWIYREDYARGGMPVLPVVDLQGGPMARQILLCCLALIPISALPALLGIAGKSYLVGALVLGVAFLVLGGALALARDERRARRLFFASLLYLPALLGLMTLDKAA